MNTLTTYFYNGASDSDAEMTAITLNAHVYYVMYFDVAIYYGAFKGSDVVPATEPFNLPGLSNVSFNAQIYRANGGNPTSRYAAAKLINQQDIQDLDDPRVILGTRYTFCSKIIEDCTPEGFFVMVWSTNRIEMPYGGDMIFIEAQNGVTNALNPCD